MKAIVQDGYGSADVLHLREIDAPAVTDDLVRLRVRAASVNALDWHAVHGGRLVSAIAYLLRSPTLPVRGVDVAGEVEAVGKNVARLRPGDEVFGVGRGTFAEYTTATEDGLAPKPRQLSFPQAATLGVAAVTSLQGLRDKGNLQPRQRVLINGAGGGVGTFAVQIARALGAHVTAVTGTRNLEVVRSMAPDEVVDRTEEDFTRRTQRYDVIFDVAADRSFSDCRRVLAPNGKLVLAGAAKSGSFAMLSRPLAALIRSGLGNNWLVPLLANVRREDLLALKELVEAGKVRPIIDREYTLSEAPDAVRYVGSGQARAKVVINVA
ncbi:MAG TPA: NAD(P)-dependent alcohol dehydrogenase [Vicinamibacterales bacterium]|nr:NAD(P)-dependent alcohol dehydrogenase [Vicinamibacterales bacterium]